MESLQRDQVLDLGDLDLRDSVPLDVPKGDAAGTETDFVGNPESTGYKQHLAEALREARLCADLARVLPEHCHQWGIGCLGSSPEMGAQSYLLAPVVWPGLFLCRLMRSTLAASRRPGRPRRPIQSYIGSFIVRDANGQALACVYFEDEPRQSYGRAPAHRDKPGRIGTNVAKLRTG